MLTALVARRTTKPMTDVARATRWFPLLTVVVTACPKAAPPPPPPPPEVEVAPVVQQDVPIYLENIGQTRGSVDVEIRARVEGFLETVDFQEGTFVKKGALLFTIDPKPFQATLAKERGRYAEAEAQLAKARQDVARYGPLVKENAISREQYDTSVSFEKAAAAAVDAQRAVVERAEIDLGYTKVFAPIDGLVGKTEVKPGNLVGSGNSTLLTTVSAIDPIHVRFTLSEREYLKLARAYGNAPETRAKEEKGFQLVLADGSVHEGGGHLVFADRLVDPTTGTLLLEASFPNPKNIVRPGQYARVRASIETVRNAIVVPQRAISELQATYSVAVVGTDGKVAMRTVKPGARFGSMRVIDSGLKAGDQVIVEGLQKVRDGITVRAVPVKAAADASASATAPASEK